MHCMMYIIHYCVVELGGPCNALLTTKSEGEKKLLSFYIHLSINNPNLIISSVVDINIIIALL